MPNETFLEMLLISLYFGHEFLPFLFFNIDLALLFFVLLEAGEFICIESFVELENVFDNKSILLLLHLFTGVKLRFKQFLTLKLPYFSDSLLSAIPEKLFELLSRLSFSSKEKFNPFLSSDGKCYSCQYDVSEKCLV